MKRYIIPIFIPHVGCPASCVFCNQQKITGLTTPVTPAEVTATLEKHINWLSQPRFVEAAFYGGSFTALPLAQQAALLQPAAAALAAGRIHAIRLSTRPDCITDEILKQLATLGVSTIELGVQSLSDDVLLASRRGHTAAAVKAAVPLLRAGGFTCGLQIMPGLPQEDWPRLLHTAYGIIGLQPDFVRIYPTVVIAGTALAAMYAAGTYTPLSLPEAIEKTAFLKLLFERHSIPVIRTGLQASEDLNSSDTVLAGPYHPAFGELTDSYIFNLLLQRALQQLQPGSRPQTLTIVHHPRDTSKLRGQSNQNMALLKRRYPQLSVSLNDSGQYLGQLEFQYQGFRCVIHKNMLPLL